MLSTETRFAVVTVPTNLVDEARERVHRYLPANYEVIYGEPHDQRPEDWTTVLVCGHDRAGWTLDEYVIPRLASGLYFAREVFFALDRVPA